MYSATKVSQKEHCQGADYNTTLSFLNVEGQMHRKVGFFLLLLVLGCRKIASSFQRRLLLLLVLVREVRIEYLQLEWTMIMRCMCLRCTFYMLICV